MKRKGNFLKCERCSDKAGHEVFFFSRVWAEQRRRPIQCPKCKNLSWDKVKKKVK